MSTLLGFYGLGSVDGTGIWDTSFSGFDYENTAQLVALLGDGSSTYNAVLQQSAHTARKATLAFAAETADMLVVRGYAESKESVVFTDADGSTSNVRVLEFSRALKFAGVWDCTAVLLEADAGVVGPGVGVPVAGLDTTLAADPAVGATNLKVASVTTVTAGQFVRAGAAGVTATELNSELVRVVTVGTTGSGGTGIDIVSDTGGGMVLDRASADEVKTVTGTVLAAPSAVGDRVLLVASVTGLSVGTVVRAGYLGHYEVRTLTAVGTAGASGTGVEFDLALLRDHAPGEWLVVVG